MRAAILAALMLCVLVISDAQAKPTPLADQFKGDRYLMKFGQASSAKDVTDAMRCPPPHCSRRVKKPKKWQREKKKQPVLGVVVPLAKVSVIPVPRARPVDAPDADEDDAVFNGVWNRIAVSLHTLEAPRVIRVFPLVRMNIFEGFMSEIERALPRRGVSLAGVVPPLVTKVHELMEKCGAIPTSAVRKTYVRGSGKRSLHWDGRAVDIVGNPRCMYPLVARWPGGVSTDYYRVRPNHMHISYGGREAGKRFAHYRGGVKRTRYARHYSKRRYASVR